MDAEFSVELGRDDPVLDFPWTDPAGQRVYRDLGKHPELLAGVSEANQHPELAEFLRIVNSARSPFVTAKCDVWTTEELTVEEEIFGASYKFASYVDVVFCDSSNRFSFPFHEQFAKHLVALLQRAPEIASSVEVCLRRCFFLEEPALGEGLYFTLYVNGYGKDETQARKNWAIGMKVLANAVVQLSASGDSSASTRSGG